VLFQTFALLSLNRFRLKSQKYRHEKRESEGRVQKRNRPIIKDRSWTGLVSFQRAECLKKTRLKGIVGYLLL